MSKIPVYIILHYNKAEWPRILDVSFDEEYINQKLEFYRGPNKHKLKGYCGYYRITRKVEAKDLPLSTAIKIMRKALKVSLVKITDKGKKKKDD